MTPEVISFYELAGDYEVNILEHLLSDIQFFQHLEDAKECLALIKVFHPIKINKEKFQIYHIQKNNFLSRKDSIPLELGYIIGYKEITNNRIKRIYLVKADSYETMYFNECEDEKGYDYDESYEDE